MTEEDIEMAEAPPTPSQPGFLRSVLGLFGWFTMFYAAMWIASSLVNSRLQPASSPISDTQKLIAAFTRPRPAEAQQYLPEAQQPVVQNPGYYQQPVRSQPSSPVYPQPSPTQQPVTSIPMSCQLDVTQQQIGSSYTMRCIGGVQ